MFQYGGQSPKILTTWMTGSVGVSGSEANNGQQAYILPSLPESVKITNTSTVPLVVTLDSRVNSDVVGYNHKYTLPNDGDCVSLGSVKAFYVSCESTTGTGSFEAIAHLFYPPMALDEIIPQSGSGVNSKG